uniref:Uncharacterized protein n=1 Tax=Leptocylindrus danicus TaxID=163516 RepID=A0A7S2P0D0_9STRA|mmetsp:Transcript_19188/g.28586  ORF Transcript_19188/g.28586 Transcript_19188/m.28586 type:complete len:129 (+) Transcript_19188:145-531(+)
MRSFLLFLLAAIVSVQGFAPSAMNGGSSFAVSQNRVTPIIESSNALPTRRGQPLMMGGKMAKFGVFSPAVYAAKFALGEKKLNQVRGKAISLHSQAIGEFCLWAGAYHLRTKLIKKAKTNGDVLGFLV